MDTVHTDQTIMKKEKCRIDETKANILALSFFSVLLIIVISFHEPWFDEAQSWLIARDASFHDMLLVIPHYEGHPPLWWFILSIPSKLGLPYEISLKTINVLFSVTAALLASGGNRQNKFIENRQNWIIEKDHTTQLHLIS